MVSFTVRLEFPEAEREKVKGYLRKLAEESRKEPGCVTFIPHLIEEGPATVLIYEQYGDQAALEHHRNSAHFSEYAANGLYKLITSRYLERLEAVA
ncbi:MAG TPA: putative quinol monooxygenase [Acidobacteriaceae bacterium]|jgi:quinol monooxygenase YgiN|nr:putative quinol monooxygenase [Acidobacteriaceae bacterium]